MRPESSTMRNNLPEDTVGQRKVIATLHRLPLFHEVTANQIFLLVRQAEHRTFHAGEAVRPSLHEGSPYFTVVLDGELLVEFDGGAHRADRPRISIRDKECYGVYAFATGQVPQGEVTALRESDVLFLHREDFEALFRDSASFRRGVRLGWERVAGQVRKPGDAPAAQASDKRFAPPHGEIVVLEVGAGEGSIPTDGLTALLATAVASHFDDKVLLIRRAAPDEKIAGRTVRVGPLKVLAVSEGKLAQTLARRGRHYDYMFVQAGDDAAVHEELRPLRDRISRVRLWHHPPTLAETSDITHPQVLETVLLFGPAPTPQRRLWGRDKTLSEGQGLSEGLPRLETRVKIDPGAVEAAWRKGRAQGIAEFIADHRTHAARWARGLTGRSVGIALGGGGAWGYAHVALIRALHDNGVPIDVISSASFGSVVGAYYTVHGLPGLDQLVERGSRMEWISRVSMTSTRLLEAQLTRDLGQVRLEETPILFHPYSTNLMTRRGVAFTRGRVALAVRASSSAPGVFGPTIVPHQGRYVDGCVTENVPTTVLYARNAVLRIAANIYPKPNARPANDGHLAAVISQLNPGARLLDAGASGSLMLHIDGVRESAIASVVYDIKESRGTSPLLAASAFGDAREVVEWAQGDPALKRSVEDAKLKWSVISGEALS